MAHQNDNEVALTVPSSQPVERAECLLFTIPLEVRKYIYQEAVVHKAVFEIAPCGDPVENMDEWQLDERSWANFRPSEPSLLLTCKQIRIEALPIFYGGNTFFETHYDLGFRKFLAWLTPDKRLMVKHLHLMPEDRSWSHGCIALAQAKLEAMMEFLRLQKIIVPQGSVYVLAKLNNRVAGSWTSTPKGVCQLALCCGNAQMAVPLDQ